MTEGAFALIDCLGFKGIWKRVPPNELIENLKHISNEVEKHKYAEGLQFTKLSYGPIDTKIKLLSDTIAISVKYSEKDSSEPNERQNELLIPLTCQVIADLLKAFLELNYPLIYRGCITYGEHISEGNFIIGPAVDVAAQFMDLPQGAFVFLHPSCYKIYRQFCIRNEYMFEALTPEIVNKMKDYPKLPPEFLNIMNEGLFERDKEIFIEALKKTMKDIFEMPLIVDRYSLPLKDGNKLITGVINPLVFYINEEERQEVIKKHFRIMDSEVLDIILKKQNTIDFLFAANKLCQDFHAKFHKEEKTA